MQTTILTDKSNVKWPLRLVLLLLLLQASALISMTINDTAQVDSAIKTKIGSMLGIQNIGSLQTIQTTQIGPLTFFQLKFFAQDNFQVSAKATQFFGFSPRISCVSGSKYHSCQ